MSWVTDLCLPDLDFVTHTLPVFRINLGDFVSTRFWPMLSFRNLELNNIIDKQPGVFCSVVFILLTLEY